MVLRKRLALMSATAAVAVMSLVGCTSTNSGSTGSATNGGGEGDPLDVLANKNARAAIAMAIDKQALCDTILNNGTIPVSYYTSKGLATNAEGKD